MLANVVKRPRSQAPSASLESDRHMNGVIPLFLTTSTQPHIIRKEYRTCSLVRQLRQASLSSFEILAVKMPVW